jgi:hypothetical protein
VWQSSTCNVGQSFTAAAGAGVGAPARCHGKLLASEPTSAAVYSPEVADRPLPVKTTTLWHFSISSSSWSMRSAVLHATWSVHTLAETALYLLQRFGTHPAVTRCRFRSRLLSGSSPILPPTFATKLLGWIEMWMVHRSYSM